ncbi:MAG: helix-turn-helix transcriptional regulator [Verrucomicrobiales bacterium]|nr:helix-turn-helix transcriptional regulator [Verrucomicrobiales bacterium]
MPAHSQIHLDRLSAQLRTKRGKRGLREVAEEIGDISASTLSRIEQGNVPDVATFMRICNWLGVDSSEFVPDAATQKNKNASREKEVNVPHVIEAHLRADRVLPPATIDALSEMIRVAYKAASEGKLGAVKK